jgi:hypothetical protein
MPTFRSVVSVLLRALGDVSLTLKAGPGGGRLRRPSPRRQRHDGTGEPASSSKPRDHEARRIWPHQPSGTAGAVVVVAIRRRKVHRMRRWTLVAGLTAALLIYSGEALADAQPAKATSTATPPTSETATGLPQARTDLDRGDGHNVVYRGGACYRFLKDRLPPGNTDQMSQCPPAPKGTPRACLLAARPLPPGSPARSSPCPPPGGWQCPAVPASQGIMDGVYACPQRVSPAAPERPWPRWDRRQGSP